MDLVTDKNLQPVACSLCTNTHWEGAAREEGGCAVAGVGNGGGGEGQRRWAWRGGGMAGLQNVEMKVVYQLGRATGYTNSAFEICCTASTLNCHPGCFCLLCVKDLNLMKTKPTCMVSRTCTASCSMLAMLHSLLVVWDKQRGINGMLSVCWTGHWQVVSRPGT